MNVLITLLALTAILTGCVNAKIGHREIVQHYEVRVPGGYAIKNVRPQLVDFDQIQIQSVTDEKQALDIYFGNHPHSSRQVDIETAKANNLIYYEGRDGVFVRNEP